MIAQVRAVPADLFGEGIGAVSGTDESRRIEGRVSQLLADRAMTLPEIRLGKIDALRRRLAAGSYVVDASQVARAIVEFELDWNR